MKHKTHGIDEERIADDLQTRIDGDSLDEKLQVKIFIFMKKISRQIPVPARSHRSLVSEYS